LDGIADGGHRGVVGAGRGLVLLEQEQEEVGVAEVAFDEGETGVADQVAEVAVLVREGVIVVEVVEADDGIAAVEQGLGESAADEPGGAGEEDGHGGSFTGRGVGIPVWPGRKT
jgi:hypothetical protein